MSKIFVLGIITLLTTASFAYGDDPNYKDLVGTWETDVPKNDSHYAEITEAQEGEEGPYVWSNKAGKRWACMAGISQAPNNGPKTYTITWGDKSPHPGHVLHLLRDSDGKLVFLREHTKDGKEVENWAMRRKDGTGGLPGTYKEKSGGEVKIRRADDAKREAGPWRFMLKGNGDWACEEGMENPGDGKPKVYFIKFAEGPFKGQRYDIVRDKNGNLKELQLVGGSKAIWVRQ